MGPLLYSSLTGRFWAEHDVKNLGRRRGLNLRTETKNQEQTILEPV
jgi:hypothetical protein